MFFGRSTELAKLGEMYGSGNFEFAVIFGRRRVGKTTLIREFIKDKAAIFYAASESTASDNLVSLSRCIGGRSNAPIFTDYESALTAVFDRADKERVVFVIDEFPYLAEAYRGISSLLQILIDHRRDSSKLMLILCGSSMNFMENQVLGHQSPLYGRRTAQFKVLPFTFFDALPFFDGFAPTDKAVLYGVTGGVPEYLTKINPRKSVRDNITDLFLSPSGSFFEEPSNLIKQELREPSTYNVIIESIASGASRLNEIATKSHIESTKCTKYLTSLMSLGLVAREHPYGEKSGKRTLYRLTDQMFRFYYRFVFPNMSAVTAGLSVFDSEVEPQLNTYMGLIFEDICKQWLFEQAKRNELPFFIGEIGRWWGANSKTRSQEEIDIMAARQSSALFAECKWRNADIGADTLSELKRKSELFPYDDVYLYLFAKTGFTSELRTFASDRVRLFTLESMIDAVTAATEITI